MLQRLLLTLKSGKTDANTADQINDRQKAVITGQTLARSIVCESRMRAHELHTYSLTSVNIDAGIGYLASIALPDL